MAVSGSKCCTCSSRRKTSRRLGPYALGICDKHTSNLSEDNYTTPKAYIWKAIEAINKIISTLTSYITHGHKLVLQEDTPLLHAQAHTPFKINDQKQSHEHNPECGKRR